MNLKQPHIQNFLISRSEKVEGYTKSGNRWPSGKKKKFYFQVLEAQSVFYKYMKENLASF